MEKRKKPAPGRQIVIHLVPSFHYDIEYLLSEGPYLEICFQNLLEAHRLLSNYPEYSFRVEQVYLVERFFQEYPSLLNDFRRFAREGRFEAAAGMYAMADINMSSGESIIRQLAVGKRWCRDVLKLEPRALDMGDCTGHPAQMPQIARVCGYDYFVFERATDDVKRKCEIRWQGIDGTEIPAYWLAVGGYAGWGYISRGGGDGNRLREIAEQLERHCLSDNRVLAQGGDFHFPYERGIETVRKWNEENPHVLIRYSTYERGLDAVDFSDAPLETREWNPDRQGCYSSRIRIKQGNRECESLLYTAEAASVLALVAFASPSDSDGLSRAWKLTFLNQFHDIFWGTHRDSAYEHALERIGRVRMICGNIIEDVLRMCIGTDSGEKRTAVFNPLPWKRRAWLQPGRMVTLPACGVAVVSSGEAVDAPTAAALAVGPSDGGTPAAGAPAAGSPAGVFHVEKTDGGGWNLETPIYSLRIAPSGVISSLRRRDTNTEFVDTRRPFSGALCYQTDRGDLWQYYDGPLHDGGPHGPCQDLVDDPYPEEAHSTTKNGRRLYLDAIDNRNGPSAELAVEELFEGRMVISLKGVLNRKFPSFREFSSEGIRIEWAQRLTLCAEDPLIEIHLDTHHQAGKWYRLRAAFFTDIRGGTILHEIPGGRFVRPEGEFAVQYYFAYFNDTKGLLVLNRGLPGANVTDGAMMLSLMRSVSIHTRVESDRAFEVGERHSFDYAILPFDVEENQSGEQALNALQPGRRGLEFNNPPYLYSSPSGLVQDAFRKMSEPALNSPPPELFELESTSVVCTAIYPSERGIVIRLVETGGREAAGLEAGAELSFCRDINSAEQTNALLETEVQLLPDEGCPTGNRLTLTFRSFEIKTIVVNLAEPVYHGRLTGTG